MKNNIRNLLLAPLLSIFNIFAIHGQTNADTIQFADPQFEAQLRSKIEMGWYYVPNYTGNDYIFQSGDFEYIGYLFLDSDYAAVSSLSDLQHFSMLNGLDVWDASKISDFSPIWNFKDQLEYLLINLMHASFVLIDRSLSMMSV